MASKEPTPIKTKIKPKDYEIHDNGGRPYFVTIIGNRVSVDKNMNEHTFNESGEFIEIPKPKKNLFVIHPDEILIGKNTPKSLGGSGDKDPQGNTILLRLDETKYRFIGNAGIYDFNLAKGDSKIEKFYSDIGNNDVPYPYAIGKTHVYFLLEHIAVEKSFFQRFMKSKSKDYNGLYDIFYVHTTHIPMCLRGHVIGRRDSSKSLRKYCDDREQAKKDLDEFDSKQTTLKMKVVDKRKY
jgi:hypothetical protein